MDFTRFYGRAIVRLLGGVSISFSELEIALARLLLSG